LDGHEPIQIMLYIKKVNFPKDIKVDPRFEKLPLKNLIIFSLATNLLFLLIAGLSTFILPPEIPLFYGLPKTSEQLVKSFLITIPSLITFILTIINSVIAINIEGQYLKKALAFVTILLTVLNIVTTYKIIALVGSI